MTLSILMFGIKTFMTKLYMNVYLNTRIYIIISSILHFFVIVENAGFLVDQILKTRIKEIFCSIYCVIPLSKSIALNFPRDVGEDKILIHYNDINLWLKIDKTFEHEDVKDVS